MRTTHEETVVRETGAPLFADRDLLRRRLLALWRDRGDDLLDRISEYALVPPGKMLRPLLVLEAARRVGGSPEELVEPALAIEYLHVATLVHDDIIDGDDVRRGRASVKAAFGVPDAIVGGDGLILETFAALAGPLPETVPAQAAVALVAAVAGAGLSVCRGQLLEAELTGDLNCGVDQYLVMAQLKTGALFESACRMGGILGAGRPEWIEALGTFGRNLGTAFQIRDDLLPFLGTSTPVGKPRESDVKNHRPTLPVLLAYQRATGRDRRRMTRIFSEDDPGEESYVQVRAIVELTGAHEAAGDFAVDIIRQAKRCLLDLPASTYSAALAEIADYALAWSS